MHRIPFELTSLALQSWSGQVQSSDQPFYTKSIENQAIVHFINGCDVEGMFMNGMMNGKCTLNWPDGLSYSADYVKNVANGYGTIYWKDGTVYEGQIVNGLRHGQGQLRSQKFIYRGSWHSGLRDGMGQLIFKQGVIYKGQFKRGMKQGLGKLTYPDGSFYEGSFKNNKKNGFGKMTWADHKQVYEGYWENDLQHGVGYYLWVSKQIQHKYLRDCYKGEWCRGVREGGGVLYQSNGSIWQGVWTNNRREGRFIKTDQQGNIEMCYFQRDHQLKQRGLRESRPQNVYARMMDLSDFLSSQAFLPHRVTRISNYQLLLNLLLRNHSHLKHYYRFFYQRYQKNDQLTFCISLAACWKMLKQLKLVTLATPLAAINRLYAQGPKNLSLQPNIQAIRQKVKLEQGLLEPKLLEQAPFLNLLRQSKDADWSGLKKQPQEAPQFSIRDIHQGKTKLLYRNFIELLVRTSHLKFGGDINKAMEKMLVKLKQFVEGNQAKEQEKPISNVPVWARQHTFRLFEKLTQDQRSLMGRVDKTVLGTTLLQLLSNSGFIKQRVEIIIFNSLMERQLDSDCQRQNSALFLRRDKWRCSTHVQSQNVSKLLTVADNQLICSDFQSVIYQFFERVMAGAQDKIQINRQKHFICFIDQLIKKAQIKGQVTIPQPPFKEEKSMLRQIRLILQQEQKQAQLANRLKKQQEERQIMEQMLMCMQDQDVQLLQDTQSQYSYEL